MTVLAGIQYTQVITIVGCASGIIAFAWKVGFSIVDRLEKSKQKQIDYAHKKSEQLEVQKLGLQKELENQKQQHVHVLIDAIKTEMSGVATKVDAMSVQFGRIDERLKSSVTIGENNMKKIQCFVDATNKRFETVEKELTIFRTEVKEIGKDVLLIKTMTDKVRNNNKAYKGG